jgi:hypothetical protein
MIKHLLLGLWICGISLGAAYGTIAWQAQQKLKTVAAANPKIEIEQVQTKRISVPIITDGVVKGYVFAQFVFNVDGGAMKTMTIKPDIFLVDEAFKVIYRGDGINFRDPEKPDVGKLAKIIKDNVNKRIGSEFVQDVFVEELNYLPQERFRGGALIGGAHFA